MCYHGIWDAARGPVELGAPVSLGRSLMVSLELFVGRQSNTRYQGSVLVFTRHLGLYKSSRYKCTGAGTMLFKAERRRANREYEVGKKISKTRDREIKREKN